MLGGAGTTGAPRGGLHYTSKRLYIFSLGFMPKQIFITDRIHASYGEMKKNQTAALQKKKHTRQVVPASL